MCPKCGYHDAICWHYYRWVTDVDVAPFHDFCEDYPQFKDIRPGQIVSDDWHYYRRSSTRNSGYWVYRWMKELGKNYYNMRDFDRAQYLPSFLKQPLPNQRRLLEVS